VLIAVDPIKDTRLITLAGGEPGLLTRPTTSQEYGPKVESEYYNRLWLPWSQLEIKLRVDGEAQRSFLNSIRSTPRRPGKLVIGEDPVGAELIVPPGAPDRGGLAGPAGIPALLELLRREDGAVDGRKACAAEEHPTAVLILAIQDRAVHGEIHALIVMTVAEECHEAVSSEGGRVRLSPEGVEELERLLGIRAP
jgi:hypothetical protein